MNAIKRPLPFVLAASGHGTLIVNRNDYRMVDADHGYGVGFQILNNSFFDPEEISHALALLDFRRQFFGDGVVAFDCGANIGVHTIEWARFMHGWGAVMAIEAQERVFYALAGNIAINNCFNATAINAAIGSAPGNMLIPRPDYLKPSSFGSLELKQSENNEFIGQPVSYAPEHCQQVSVVSVDGFNLPRLDFIKIDIEGMELDALEGARQTIALHKPQMLIESIKSSKDEIIAFLKSNGYEYFFAGINILAIHSTDPTREQVKQL
jgi:FkbM family methyltransferase